MYEYTRKTTKAQLSARIDDANFQLAKRDTRIFELEAKVVERDAKYARCEAVLEEFRAAYRDLREDYNKQERTASATIGELAARLKERDSKIVELEAKIQELEKPRNMAPGAQAGRLAARLGEGFFIRGYRDDGGRLKFWFKRTPPKHELAGKRLYESDVKTWMSAHSL